MYFETNSLGLRLTGPCFKPHSFRPAPHTWPAIFRVNKEASCASPRRAGAFHTSITCKQLESIDTNEGRRVVYVTNHLQHPTTKWKVDPKCSSASGARKCLGCARPPEMPMGPRSGITKWSPKFSKKYLLEAKKLRLRKETTVENKLKSLL